MTVSPFWLSTSLVVVTMPRLPLLEVQKKVLKPVFAGDTVHAEVEVVAVRPTSKGNRGIVTTVNDVVNQDGETVITYRAVRMMAGRPAGDG